jgi:hypothetical protein
MEQNINDMFTNIMNDFNFPQTQYTTSLNDTNRNQNIPSNPSMRYVNRQLDTIYELILRYNDNMIQYQRNMTQMVSLINMNNLTFRHRLQEIRNDRNTQYRNTNPQQRTRFQHYQNIPFNNWTFQTPLFSTSQNRPLTQQEINTMTTTITFNDETRNEITETRCPISLDNFQSGDTLCKINGCNHIFRKDNLLNWFRRNSKCPICRFDLRNALNNRRNGNSRGRSRTRDTSGNNTNRSPRRNNTNRSPRPTQENNSEGFMRDPSGNRLDSSNNYWNSALDEQLTNMVQSFVDTTLSNNQFNTAAGENIFDISFNFSPIYRTTNTTENNENQDENQDEDENNSDDDSSVIQDNLSVD